MATIAAAVSSGESSSAISDKRFSVVMSVKSNSCGSVNYSV